MIQEDAAKRVPSTALFAVVPGEVQSKNDGQFHFINADQLMRLYRVPPQLCIICRDRESRRLVHWGCVMELSPRYDGDYRLPAYLREKVDAWIQANASGEGQPEKDYE